MQLVHMLHGVARHVREHGTLPPSTRSTPASVGGMARAMHAMLLYLAISASACSLQPSIADQLSASTKAAAAVEGL